MRVLQNQTALPENGLPSVINQALSLVQQTSYNEKPILDLVNNALQAANQTLMQVVNQRKTEQLLENIQKSNSFENQWNFLYFLRIFFYIVVVLKLIELVFSKRKKMDIKQRVYRKYVFSHAQMIREFNQDDRKVMQTTLKNTIKNATLDKGLPKLIKKPSNKRVVFHETKNEYIQPRKDTQNNSPLSALQMFLSRGNNSMSMLDPLQQIAKQIAEKQFKIIQTIEQKQEVTESTIFAKEEQSSITQSTAAQSYIVSGQPYTFLDKKQENEQKQKNS